MTAGDLSKPLASARLILEPLSVDHAPEMVAVLADPALYVFTGGEPPSIADLARRYTAQVAGSGDDAELWLNWIMRDTDTSSAVGFIQATVERGETSVAWTVSTDWQGRGFGAEAAVAMATWLTQQGTSPLVAWIHPDHIASHKVAEAIGLTRTGEVDEDGEYAWR